MPGFRVSIRGVSGTGPCNGAAPGCAPCESDTLCLTIPAGTVAYTGGLAIGGSYTLTRQYLRCDTIYYNSLLPELEAQYDEFLAQSATWPPGYRRQVWLWKGLPDSGGASQLYLAAHDFFSYFPVDRVRVTVRTKQVVGFLTYRAVSPGGAGEDATSRGLASDAGALCLGGTASGVIPSASAPPAGAPSTIAVSVKFGACPAYGAAPVMMAAYAPPPPSPDASAPPTARHAVVTLAVGQKGRDLLAVSRPLMEAAARRWGADFRVIEGPDTDFNIGEKLRLYDYLKPYPAGYDRVFYLDADALILPTAPNPFELFPAGRPYASDDLVGQPHAADWIDRENREVCESQGWDWGGPLLEYWNSGVWLVDAAHAPAFEPPARPYPVYHCSEQHAVNERMRSNGFEVADFGRAWNWQWWVESKMAPPPGTHVLHFSGMDPITSTDPDAHGRRLALMRQFATRKLPLECVHLGPRTEFRPGCGGARCLHGCARGRPAVPAEYCQTCESYEEPPAD